MLKQSQPLDQKFCEKLGLNDDEQESYSERHIKSQRIGEMFDDLLSGSRMRKISLKTRIGWKMRRIKDLYYNCRYAIRNHAKWHETMCTIRPWEGFDGLISVMIMHLQDYVVTEEKYGHSDEEYKKMKIDSVRETIEVLKRMKEPDEYSHRRREEAEAKYPDYKHLISEYEDGGRGYSGDFIAQGEGWVGIESGKDSRKGYFEFADGRFELVNSPNQDETYRLLDEIRRYHEEISLAYQQAEKDSDSDFERLGQLLKENLYTWWD